MDSERPIRVLVVDDSAFMRKVIGDLLNAAPGIEVVGLARDGLEAVAEAARLSPDVITLDVEMPRLDGLEALRRIMTASPTRVVMVSSLTQEGADTTIRALALGAVDFVAKPSGSVSLDMARVRQELIDKVRLAAASRVDRTSRLDLTRAPLAPRPRPAKASVPERPAERAIVIGCSTGGPGALHRLLPRLPAGLAAGVLIVQHMPPGFTRSLAERLDEVSLIEVREAREGDRVVEGRALVAPGGSHLLLDRGGTVRLSQDPPVHGVRPAVDKTLASVVEVYGANLVVVILTGMGTDGARGALLARRGGGLVLAQSEETSVVWGMPRAAVEVGAASEQVALDDMADRLVGYVKAAAV